MAKRNAASAIFAAVFLVLGIFAAAARAENPASAADTTSSAGATGTPATIGTAGATGTVKFDVPRFDIKDVNGRLIYGEQLKGWIVVYAFGNEDNAETGVGWLKEVAKTNPTEDGVLFVIIADASRYPNVMGPFVKKVMKKEYRKEIDRLEQELDERNIHPPFKMENRYLMVANMSGAYFRLFGIGDQKNVPHIFFVDGGHGVRAHYTSRTDEMVGTLGTLISERKSQNRFTLDIKKKKKNKFKRYAVIGALVWLGFELF